MDIRAAGELDNQDLTILKKIINLFTAAQTFLVAGRHYGDIVTAENFFPEERIFISLGDCEIFIDSLA